ncbi:hypothetical protein BOX15_Mlig000221g1, partial [Macrostomum lignano]
GMVASWLGEIMDEITIAYILFILAVLPLVIWIFQMLFFALAWYTCRRHLYHPKTAGDVKGDLPGVSIIKPLMGVDPFLEGNLESHFTLQYPNLELLLCVQDERDPVIELVHKLQARFPDVDCQLFVGGKPGVTNPMVHNMAPAYERAKHDLVWVSTSRIRASTAILLDLVASVQSDPHVAICHQLPYMMNDGVGGIAATVEKLAFGCNMGRNYLALNRLGTHVFTGMSYLVRKSYLDEVGGLAHYGRYLAEDYFLSQALHSRGYELVLSAFPAQQMVAASSIAGYKDRMVRWWRLRLNMMPLVTLLLEPLTECVPLGAYISWAVYYLFDVNPYLVFAVHAVMWISLDYHQLRLIQNSPLPFRLPNFLAAWCLRELLNAFVYVEGLLNPRRVRWGKNTYRVTLGGHTTLVTTAPVLPL